MKKYIIIICLITIILFFGTVRVQAYSSSIDAQNIDITDKQMTCSELLGPNLTKVLKAGINLVMIAGAIIAIVSGMLTLLPAVMNKDADALKKASKKLVSMGIVLAVIFMLPSLARIIGSILGFDISCII